ncbi:MAG: sulfatase [Bryobacterales bacterium]|nr:sulfatase [Bryobacterales bacterium]
MLSRRQLFASTLAAAPAFAQTRRRPNILFIMSDDHASHAIGAYGSKINETPNIDRLAKGGLRLDNCFVTNSICTPSRACILTGQYSHVNGVKTLSDAIDPKTTHVGHLLRNAGYQTAMIGKWHLQTNPEGFDYWRVLPGQGLYYDPVFIHQDGTRKKYEGYCTDLIADFTLDWLKTGRDKSKPFFLMCHHKAPHREWTPPKKYQDWLKDEKVPEPDNLYEDISKRSAAAQRATLRVGDDMTKTDLKVDRPAGLEGRALRQWAYQLYIKDYLRCIRSVDDNVGRVLDYLDAEGLTEDTLVIYTSDQGFFLGDHGWYDKRFMYEETMRMPLLARYPKAIKPGSTNRDIILNIDFAPTFLALAGQKAPAVMQGESFLPQLEGKKPGKWRKSMYYRYWMHLGGGHTVTAHYGVRTHTHKLIYYYGQALGSKGAVDQPTPPEWEMFDLVKDPREMKNVYGDPAYASVEAELKAELNRLRTHYRDQA